MTAAPGALRWVVRIAAAVVVLLAIASALPLVETNAWWVRYLDFPRVQLAVALAVAMALHFLLAGGSLPVLLAGAAALGYHGYKLYPYLPIFPPLATPVAECPEGQRLSLLVANVQRSNRQAGAFLALVAAEDPDLVLVLETDAWWDAALAPLDAAYPERVQHIPEQAAFFGMHLFSRLPLLDPEVAFAFDAATPSIVTGVALPAGGTVRLHGLHPRPPLFWSQPTTLRDATLLAAALDAAASPAPTILAGDLNAVPWERVTRRALRLGGLLDPRVGRGLLPTYDAESRVMAWPLDHVLHQPGLGLLDFRRLPAIGSDHFPVAAALCLAPDLAARQPPPAPEPNDRAEAEASIRAARALEPRL